MKRTQTPESIPRTPNRQQGAHMTAVLAQLRSSRSIHFVKAVPKSAFDQRPSGKFYIPLKFVQDHGAKVKGAVTLRVRTSRGRSSRSWPVHFIVSVTSVTIVAISAEWPAFAADNRLQPGDFVVFVLREDAESEFEVLVFRGPRAFPFFPDQGPENVLAKMKKKEIIDLSSDDDSEEEEETNNQSRLPSPAGHQQDERRNQTFRRRDVGEQNPAPLQHTGNPRVPRRFPKRLKASNIGRSSGGRTVLGQFEFPSGFIRAHGEHVHGTVKLQGVGENSPSYVMICRRRPKNLLKVYFVPSDWSRFVHENDLKEGQVLQFTLMADSYFLVRRISA